MTGRTFREPSPHRPSTSSGPTGSRNSSFVDVPPLPSLPTQYENRKLPARRTVSVDPTTRSPPASPRSIGRGTSVDREREGASAIYSAPHNRISSLSTVPEMERPGSRGSVNFSYPMNSRPTSPALNENRPLSLGASAAREVLSSEFPSMQRSISEKPANAKPRSQPAGDVEGNTDGAAGPPVGNAIAAAQAVSSQKNNSRAELPARDDEQTEHDPSSTHLADHEVDSALPIAITSSESEHPSSRTVPERWPATVPEEHEPEDGDDDAPSHAPEPTNRLASASPTIDHVEAVSTPPQSPPSAQKEVSPQQQAHLRQSSSPGRSARFARWLSVTAAGDQVHQPPPRSVSPVKSALKQHPRGASLSPDRRVGIAGRGSLAPSELSDGTSVASDDGSRVGVKKRPVKVSFDDEAEVVGVAASPPTSPEEYVPDSPPGKSKRMSWLGVGKKKHPASELGTGDDDYDVKPRRVLPSFGSVRGNRDGGVLGAPIPEFSDNESSSTSSDELAASRNSFSNDHALGGVLQKPQQDSSQAHNIKTVGQVSVNGDASVSHQRPSDNATRPGITSQPPYTAVNPEPHVPAIAVEPATPPVDNEKLSMDLKRSSLDSYQIPGGFPPSNSDRSLKTTAEGTKAQPVASVVPKLDDVDTEGESGDSVYSDAAEDFDGDGFGSINAIVDTRSIPQTVPTSGTVSQSRDTTPRPADRTAVVDSQSQDVTDQALEQVRSATPTQESVSRQAEESPKSPTKERGWDGPYPPLPIKSQARFTQNKNPQPQANKLRRPMSVDARGVSDPQDYRRVNNAAEAGKAKTRPLSLGPAFQRNGGPGLAAGFPGTLRRMKSNDSDSSSSFKRASPSTRGDGPHAMRRTMRASPTQGWVPTDRTESPIEHRPLSSGSSTGGTMRKTLRSPSTGGERLSFFSTNKKAQRARFAKSPPKSMQPSRFADSDDEGGQSQPQVFRSRFADSSDEEDQPGNNSMRPVRGIPRRHGAHDGDSTELDDSSEEDHRQRQQPVAIAPADPTPPGSRDKDGSKMSGMAAVARQRGMSQRELEQFLMQPPRSRKPSILHRLGLKKPKNSDHRIRKADVESPSRRDTPLERSRLEREQVRGDSFVNGNHGTTVTTVSAASPEGPSLPRLLKKNNKRHTVADDSWPLRTDPRTETPEPDVKQSQSVPTSPLRTEKREPPVDTIGRNGKIIVNGVKGAPAVQEPGSPGAGHAAPVNDNSSDITNPEDHGPSARDVVISGSGRKKRFPLLRKAFGLRS